MPPELMEFDPVFQLSNSMWRNLVHTFKNFSTTMGNEV